MKESPIIPPVHPFHGSTSKKHEALASTRIFQDLGKNDLDIEELAMKLFVPEIAVSPTLPRREGVSLLKSLIPSLDHEVPVSRTGNTCRTSTSTTITSVISVQDAFETYCYEDGDVYLAIRALEHYQQQSPKVYLPQAPDPICFARRQKAKWRLNQKRQAQKLRRPNLKKRYPYRSFAAKRRTRLAGKFQAENSMLWTPMAHAHSLV